MYYHKKNHVYSVIQILLIQKQLKVTVLLATKANKIKKNWWKTTYIEFKIVQYESNLLPIFPSVFKLGLGLYRQV